MQKSASRQLRLPSFVPCGGHVRVVGRSRFDGDPGVPLSAWTPCEVWAKRIVVVNFQEGRLRVFFRGSWRDAKLKPRTGDPEVYLRRMNGTHAAFVRMESSMPELVEITPE